MFALAPSTRLTRLTVAGSLIMVALSGCSESLGKPVDTAVAESALQTVLESWLAGDMPESQHEASPRIVVQDADWLARKRLERYEILGNGTEEGQNLVVRVRLTLKSQEDSEDGTPGTSEQKVVTYVVGTSPVLTVFRDPMRP